MQQHDMLNIWLKIAKISSLKTKIKTNLECNIATINWDATVPLVIEGGRKPKHKTQILVLLIMLSLPPSKALPSNLFIDNFLGC